MGKMWRQVITRMQRPIRHTKKGGTDKSGIGKHSCENKHHILFEETVITTKIRNDFQMGDNIGDRNIKNKNNFNRGDRNFKNKNNFNRDNS